MKWLYVAKQTPVGIVFQNYLVSKLLIIAIEYLH